MDQLVQAAQSLISALQLLGFCHVCFVGSMANRLHGNSRTPNDLDILIMAPGSTSESIKQALVSSYHSNNSFYLVPSINPLATYKKLYYGTRFGRIGSRIKIDVLLADNDMDLPSIPQACIQRVNGLPIAPLSLALLFKLKSWDDHRLNPIQYHNSKQYTDVNDLYNLLLICTNHRLRPLTCSEVYSHDTLVRQSKERVLRYTSIYPTTKDRWRSLGFAVAEAPRIPAYYFDTEL